MVTLSVPAWGNLGNVGDVGVGEMGDASFKDILSILLGLCVFIEKSNF